MFDTNAPLKRTWRVTLVISQLLSGLCMIAGSMAVGALGVYNVQHGPAYHQAVEDYVSCMLTKSTMNNLNTPPVLVNGVEFPHCVQPPPEPWWLPFNLTVTTFLGGLLFGIGAAVIVGTVVQLIKERRKT